MQPERLIGANLRYVETHLPHLQRMLCASPDEALQGAGIAVVATADSEVVRALLDADSPLVLDLHGGLGAEVESLPGYRGIALVTARMRAPRRRRVLIIVQNLPVPFDRRVWLECQALGDAGYERVGDLPARGRASAADEVLDGVRIHRYRPAPDARGQRRYVVEFAYCWLRTARLVVRACSRGGGST